MRYLGENHGSDIVCANITARYIVAASLGNKRARDVLFRIPSPAAVWRDPKDLYSPKTNRAKLALLEACDHVKIGVYDDPKQKPIEMEKVARQLISYDHINLTEAHKPS